MNENFFGPLLAAILIFLLAAGSCALCLAFISFSFDFSEGDRFVMVLAGGLAVLWAYCSKEKTA